MLKLMLIAALIGAGPDDLGADRGRFMVRVHRARDVTAPPRLDMYKLNHGKPGELEFSYAYIEKDEPPGEFDIRVSVVDPVDGSAVARDVRRVAARRSPRVPGAFYFEPKGPDPTTGRAGYFVAEFRRKLAPGKYRVTVSAGGIIAMTRDYVVTGE